MNAVLEAIKTRRSIRSYEPTPVSREVLSTIVEAASDAPSAMNTQPWRFVVVEDEKFRQTLVQTALPEARQYFELLKESAPERYARVMRRFEDLADPVYYSAPAIVFVIGSGPNAADACPIACQNMMLAASSLGLGSCWVKLGSLVTENPEITTALDLKGEEKIFGPILLGYPKQIPPAPAKNQPVIKWI
jgi:nitroreductase